jgi:hypothetical protein
VNPEKWQLIRRIFHEAVELPQGERGLFVSRAAAGDEFLRIEVESLLASHDSAASFIESPGDRVTTIALKVGTYYGSMPIGPAPWTSIRRLGI